jgi:tungstate transport system ATP-binding protein
MGLTLSIFNVYKSYDGKHVLKDCSYLFERSGTYVLTGPNGSGKSTVFRICTLLEDPDRGDVNYLSEGSAVAKTIELKRRITLLLPKVGVFNTTVFKNVAYGLMIRGINRDEMTERVMKALDFVGLKHKTNQKALTLSSGETQRLGIARSMVIEPEILFLDEPTASVDQENTEIIEDIILKVKKMGKSIVVITTHDMAQAERLADWLLLMKDGKIIPS